MIDLINIISLYIKFSDRQLYIYNIHNFVNIEEISINILILKQKFAKNLYISFGNFHLYYKL